MPDIQESDLRTTFPIDTRIKSESIGFALSQARIFTISAVTQAVYDDVVSDSPTNALRSEDVRNAMLKLAYAHLVEQNAFRLNQTGVLHRELDASTSAVGGNITHEFQRIGDVQAYAERLAHEARVTIRQYSDELINRSQFRRIERA